MNTIENRDGFTLVELIMVMLLIGVMAGIAVPLLRPEKFQLEAAVASVASTLNAQQRSAVLRQHNVNVAFDTSAMLLRVHYDKNNDGVIDADENWHVVELEAAVVFGKGNAAARALGSLPVSMTDVQTAFPVIIYQRNGSTNEESLIYLTSLKAIAGASGQDTRAIEVERATGRTRCYSYNSGAWEQTC